MKEGTFFTFGHCSIINALCEGACVKGASNDLTQMNPNAMDVG